MTFCNSRVELKIRAVTLDNFVWVSSSNYFRSELIKQMQWWCNVDTCHVCVTVFEQTELWDRLTARWTVSTRSASTRHSAVTITSAVQHKVLPGTASIHTTEQQMNVDRVMMMRLAAEAGQVCCCSSLSRPVSPETLLSAAQSQWSASYVT